ncbi:tetratricopeptide repeat protein [Caulobacter hibisci]|uniref:DUF1570 domain-containing protein n=1 Tax=Caulobacter hibisci TaxID=2035993 RepID=A0ABS0T3R7_9CAUL|nr:hypothetical protein [Caulobacter hibisci]MBI1686530.1 hypothetical protein [Caulobacter hibisci]
MSVRWTGVGVAIAAALSVWTPALAQPAAPPPPAVADPTGRWMRAESTHFVVYSDRSEALVRRYVAMLEDFDGVLRLLHDKTDAETPRKLPFYLVSSTQQMRRVIPGASEGLRGIYSTALEDIFVVAIREDGGRYDRNNGDDVVLHEYTHHFMMQYFPAGYPGWLIEGLAEYYMTVDLQPEKVLIGDFSRSRAASLMNKTWVPMADVLSKKPGQIPEADRGVYYAQSWLLTHYVWNDKGRRSQLSRYLKAVREGADPMASWTKVYGQDGKQLEKALVKYMDNLSGMELKRTPPPAPEIVFTRLPEGADDLILEVQRLKQDIPPAEADAFLAKIRKIVAKRPNEFYSRRVLARTECDLGDRKQCEVMLKALLDERPQDLETLQILAASRLSSARKAVRDKADREQVQAIYADAAQYLGRIHKIDPNDYMALFGYAQTRSLEKTPSENTLNVITRAAEIAPQASLIRMTAARLFIQAKAYEEACEMMAPVAGNPHGGARAKYAAQLMAELRDKADGEALPAGSQAAVFAERG